jgi:RNA polymerase sigma-70 factor (ECF subfamily)
VSESPYIADVKLVERMLAGEEDAFETFAERCFKPLYRFASARLQGDRELTREIVQTTVTKALAKLATYRGEASLLTWLCACCRNEILMHRRRSRTEPAELGSEDEIDARAAGGGPHPEAALLSQERALRVHMALDGLPAHYSRALEWKYLDRLPVQEIAARMGVQPKAAESLLTRARQAFRTMYESLQEPSHGRTRSER